ncbi:hypothetical protein WSM22_00330 [Cytophagales bacterium WSM2-2]|nr:hypothetical protein WSM22_00330 [Cytophagales bacterium WSM2-2]
MPTFEGMDLNQWKEDKNGCKKERLKMLTPFRDQQDKLKGLSEDKIIALLGRPDQNELYKRNQKFYKYFIEPGNSCETDSASLMLTIRFNAMGLAKEINFVSED